MKIGEFRRMITVDLAVTPPIGPESTGSANTTDPVSVGSRADRASAKKEGGTQPAVHRGAA